MKLSGSKRVRWVLGTLGVVGLAALLIVPTAVGGRITSTVADRWRQISAPHPEAPSHAPHSWGAVEHSATPMPRLPGRVELPGRGWRRGHESATPMPRLSGPIATVKNAREPRRPEGHISPSR
jgi:hypothetical protein